MEAVTVPTPRWRLTIAGTDVSAELAPMALSITYTDNLEESADEVEVTLENRDRRWMHAWYPTKGDQLSLELGFAGQRLLPCGDFTIDEIELTGPPDRVTLRAQAVEVGEAMKTVKNRAWENTSLRQVVDTIASEHGLAVIGTIADLPFDRLTQTRTDLRFLQRLAEETGHVFSQRGLNLVFHRRDQLAAESPVANLTRADLSDWEFKDKVHGTYDKVVVLYHDPATRELVQAEAKSPDASFWSPDTLRVFRPCQSPAHAEAVANSLLSSANLDEVTARLTMAAGRPDLVAGVVVGLDGFGVLDGRYQVQKSTHRIERSSGYRTELELARVARSA